jgi:hypothetical protein
MNERHPRRRDGHTGNSTTRSPRRGPQRTDSGYGQRGGYNETAGPDDTRSSLYGSGQPPGERGNFGGAHGSESGYEFARGHRGKSPRDYTRSDARIREELCERLTEDDAIDPSDVSVAVDDGVVTLTGTVEHRWVKHSIEDMAEALGGVKDIVNQLRVSRSGGAPTVR